MTEEERRRSWFVTANLSLGDLRDDSRCVRVVTLEEALSVIRSGGHAVLPAGEWDLADEVLWRLGLGRSARTYELFWARTGRLRGPVVGEGDEAENPRRPTEPTVGTWPDPPDGDKTGPWELLDEEMAELASPRGDAYRHSTVLRWVDQAVPNGMHPRDALRWALDETAAQDEAHDAMLAERLRRAIGEEPDDL